MIRFKANVLQNHRNDSQNHKYHGVAMAKSCYSLAGIFISYFTVFVTFQSNNYEIFLAMEFLYYLFLIRAGNY